MTHLREICPADDAQTSRGTKRNFRCQRAVRQVGFASLLVLFSSSCESEQRRELRLPTPRVSPTSADSSTEQTRARLSRSTDASVQAIVDKPFPEGDWFRCDDDACSSLAGGSGRRFHADGTWSWIGPVQGHWSATSQYCVMRAADPMHGGKWRRAGKLTAMVNGEPFRRAASDDAIATKKSRVAPRRLSRHLRLDATFAEPRCLSYGEPCSADGFCLYGGCASGVCGRYSPLYEAW